MRHRTGPGRARAMSPKTLMVTRPVSAKSIESLVEGDMFLRLEKLSEHNRKKSKISLPSVSILGARSDGK